MESTPRWGITLPLRSVPLPEQRDLVAALPGLGYTDAWSSEVNGTDAFAPLAAAGNTSITGKTTGALGQASTRQPISAQWQSRRSWRHRPRHRSSNSELGS